MQNGGVHHAVTGGGCTAISNYGSQVSPIIIVYDQNQTIVTWFGSLSGQLQNSSCVDEQ